MAKLNCDDAPLVEFRNAVLQKHGKLYGVLKVEVNVALIAHTKKILKDMAVKHDRF